MMEVALVILVLVLFWCGAGSFAAARAARHLTAAVEHLTRREVELMAKLQDLIDEVKATEGVEQSAITAINGLIAALQAAGGDPAAIQAVIDEAKANRDALAAAIAAIPPPA